MKDFESAMLKYTWGSVSITGNFRENNEDRKLVDTDGRYFIVADGMGGQSAGEKASELATEIVSENLEKLVDFESDTPEKACQDIDTAVSEANQEIMALGEIQPEFHKMGTTVAFLIAIQDRFVVGGIGDSRIYLLRDGALEQLTTDHSLTQALLDAGTISREEAKHHRYKNVLYRYLGSKDGGTGTNAQIMEPTPGDRLVLCSDGVTDGLDDDAIALFLKTLDDPQEAAQRLVDEALKGGSRDNITCVTVYVE